MKNRRKQALKAFKKAKSQKELDRLIRMYPDIAVLEEVDKLLYEIRLKIIKG